MVDTGDIETLLKTGSWATSRAKSPQLPHHPVRANTSAKLDPDVPRPFNLKLHGSNFPPPPSVEDEAQSLAREHGSSVVSSSSDDQPKYRGDLEQQPILLPVPEFNPERRFVLVPNNVDEATTGDDTSHGTRPTTERKQQGKASHDASDRRRETLDPRKQGLSAEEPAKGPLLERRKSRQDLPQINTSVQGHHHRPSLQRSKSATSMDKREADDSDNYDQPPSGGLLSPHITYSAKGRDRAYWDYNAGSRNGTARNRHVADDPRATPVEKRRGEGYRATHSQDPPTYHRSNSTESPRLARRASERDRYRDVSSHRMSAKGASPPMARKDSYPLRSDRSSASPPYHLQSARDREPSSGRYSAYKGRRTSPPVEDDEYTSESLAKSERSNRRRTSFHSQDGRNPLLSPDQLRYPARGPPRSPVASPRIVQGQFPNSARPPSPCVAPSPNDGKRADKEAVSSFPSESSAPKSGTRVDDGQLGRAQTHSRAASTNLGLSNTSAPIVVPIPIPASSAVIPAVESRRSPLPSPSNSHENSVEVSPASYQPSQATQAPTESHTTWDKPIVSYRRYLEDVQRGAAPKFPECRRKFPSAGHFDWLTLPQAVNFDICPHCYESVFSDTPFKHSFVPSPLHGAEKPVSCDFGSSPWYKIAWLMTLKHHIPDLHLLQGIAAAVSKGQKCAGNSSSTRIWYSISDPHHRRPISSFTLCQHCAKTAEVILPNLTGVFVPLDGPSEPTRGVCAMHFAPGRTRFVDTFDILESVSDRALSRGSPPDFQKLANSIRELSLMPECMREEQLRECKWFIMEPIPDFTVCEECFDQVVWPIVESDEEGSVANKFFKRAQRLPLAACQLYSDRMREVFRKACRRNDMKYLEDRVKERLDIEAAIKAKLTENLTEAETQELVRKWEEWE